MDKDEIKPCKPQDGDAVAIELPLSFTDLQVGDNIIKHEIIDDKVHHWKTTTQIFDEGEAANKTIDNICLLDHEAVINFADGTFLVLKAYAWDGYRGDAGIEVLASKFNPAS